MRILDAALATLWAITPDGLDAIKEIYLQAIARGGPISEEQLAQIMVDNSELGEQLHLTSSIQTGSPLNDDSRYTFIYPNGVAQMNLIGPIYPRANAMTSSGAVSLQSFTAEYVRAMEDARVKGVVLNVDSPGGDVRGLADASNLMWGYSKKRKKPVKAFASGYMASAAYHIGSMAQEIIASQSAIVGSIGVVLSARAKGQGEYEIVASQSPHKRLDPSDDVGLARMQARVDALAEVMISNIASFRGVSTEKVLSDYGQGDVLVGVKAKKSGLVDSIGTLESVIEQVAREFETKSYRVVKPKVSVIDAEVADLLSFTTQEKEEMGLRDLVSKFAASDDIVEGVTDEQAQHDDPETEESTGESPEPSNAGPENFGSNLDPSVIAAKREELEEQYSDSAELFVTQILHNNRILPAQQPHAIADFLIAKTDDALFGGTVTFVDVTGEVKEGTREQAVRARYEATPAHTLTQKAIKGIKAGSIAANVLNEEDPESKDKKDEGPVSDERRQKLLSQTEQGRQALAQVSNK